MDDGSGSFPDWRLPRVDRGSFESPSHHMHAAALVAESIQQTVAHHSAFTHSRQRMREYQLQLLNAAKALHFHATAFAACCDSIRDDVASLQSCDDDANTDNALLESGRFWCEWDQVRLLFIGLSSPHSPLRHLPAELTSRIARSVYRPRWRPKLVLPAFPAASISQDGTRLRMPIHPLFFESDDPTRLMHLSTAPPLRDGVHYIELHLNHLIFGSEIDVCGLRIHFCNLAYDGAMHQHVEITGRDIADADPEDPGSAHVKAWDDCWLFGISTNTIGALLDLPRRQIALSLNGVNGPHVPMPSGWGSSDLTVKPIASVLDDVGCSDNLCVSITTPACVPKALSQLPLYHGLCTGCEYCGTVEEDD